MDLYVYYKVDPAAAAELATRVAAMQAGLSMAATLRRRPGEQNGRQTWMEIYPDVPAGFDAVLAQAASDSGIAGLIDGPRHTEIFVELEECA